MSNMCKANRLILLSGIVVAAVSILLLNKHSSTLNEITSKSEIRSWQLMNQLPVAQVLPETKYPVLTQVPAVGADYSSVQEVKRQSEHTSNELILKFQQGVTVDAIKEYVAQHNLTLTDYDDQLLSIGYHKVHLAEGVTVKEFLRSIHKEKSLLLQHAEPNYLMSLLSVEDPYYDNQWYIQNAKFDQVWPLLNNTNKVLVAIIDTGVDETHEELQGKCIEGYNFIDNSIIQADDHGHGTFVAGIIAANWNDKGVRGLSPVAGIIPIKAFDENGVGTYEDVARAVIFAADNGAKIINFSAGGYADSYILYDAVSYALEKGCIIVSGGGNDGEDAVVYPAGYAEVIGVGALGRNSDILELSNRGGHIDVVAPGESIFSIEPGNGYKTVSGSSASAAIVSSLASILVSQKDGLSNTELRNIILLTARDLGEEGKDGIYGYGIVDAFAALTENVEPVHDMVVAEMGRDSIKPSQTNEDDLSVLHNITPPVHQWVAGEAYQYAKASLLPSEAVTEFDLYIPAKTTITVEGHLVPGYNEIYQVIKGSREEDEIGFMPFNNHFWDQDQGPNSGKLIFADENAYQRALGYWNSATNSYAGGAKSSAYYTLGRIVHLLTDMSVPAHVHLDIHPVHDTYESYMAEYNDDLVNRYNYHQWTAGGYVLSYNTLFGLFNNMADLADDYDSNDAGGESPSHTLGHSSVEEMQNVYDLHNVSYADAKVHGNTLMPAAINHVANLYKMFWNVTHGDSNNNDVPDSWEIIYFGMVSNVSAVTDFDSDKLPDYYEYLGHSDPTNPLSCIRIQSSSMEAYPTFSWYSGTGMVYTIERSTNLLIGFDVINSNILATPPMNVYTDQTITSESSWFYNIVLE